MILVVFSGFENGGRSFVIISEAATNLHGVPLLDWAHGGRMECVQIAKRNIDLFASPRSQNVILCFAPASQNGLKGKNTRP